MKKLLIIFLISLCFAPAAEAKPMKCYDAYLQKKIKGMEALCLAQNSENNPRVQYVLGVIHTLGWDVEIDKAKGMEWFSKAANSGHLGAQQGIITMQIAKIFGSFKKNDVDEALKEWEKIIYFGHMDALYSISTMLRYYSTYSASEVGKWISLLEERAKHNAVAAYIVGSLYQIGIQDPSGDRGIKIDQDKALAYYQKATNRFTAAYTAMGLLYSGKKEPKKSTENYKIAIEKGSVDAKCSFGHTLRASAKTKVEKEKAFEYMLKAAKEGRILCQQGVAIRYESGDGVEQSYEEAYKWLYITLFRYSDKVFVDSSVFTTLLFEKMKGKLPQEQVTRLSAEAENWKPSKDLGY